MFLTADDEQPVVDCRSLFIRISGLLRLSNGGGGGGDSPRLISPPPHKSISQKHNYCVDANHLRPNVCCIK